METTKQPPCAPTSVRLRRWTSAGDARTHRLAARRLHRLLNEAGIKGADAHYAYVAREIDVVVASLTELTSDQMVEIEATLKRSPETPVSGRQWGYRGLSLRVTLLEAGGVKVACGGVYEPGSSYAKRFALLAECPTPESQRAETERLADEYLQTLTGRVL